MQLLSHVASIFTHRTREFPLDSPRLYLADHVFLCCMMRHCIFLDLKADRYFSISRTEAEILGEFLDGWTPTNVAHDRFPPSVTDVPSLASALLSRGVLRLSCDGAKEARQIRVEAPTSELLLERDIKTATYFLHLPTFVLRTTLAHTLLRRKRFEVIIASVRSRKCHALNSGAAKSDIATVTHLAAIFARMRPLFPRAFLCLFDSLAMLEFLAAFNQFPTWVFGVRDDPFEAHCWLQEGTVLLNDRRERIEAFTPIMAI
jgi:Transglutaminase-like superfamily